MDQIARNPRRVEPDDLDPHYRWDRALSAFGTMAVDFESRVDFDRLRRYRIGVTLVCPGGVDTPLTGTVDVAGVDPEAPHMQRLTARFRRHAKSPEHAARCILDGVTHNRYLVYTSADIRALHALQRFAPPAYAWGMQLANNRFVKEIRGPRA